MKYIDTIIGRILLVGVTFGVLFIFSCKSMQTVPPAPKNIVSVKLVEKGLLNEDQLTDFFMANNSNIPREEVLQLAKYYIAESNVEGINSDAAFAQMCLETGFLRFGNLVKKEMYNFAGLGAIDEKRPGEYFPTEEIGVRAHIQHLHAYCTTEDISLKNELVDNRYKYVQPRGKAKDIFGLSGTWAADEHYGEKIDAMLKKMQDMIN